MADTITLAIDALASAAFIEGGVSIERTDEARQYTEQRKRELIEAIAAGQLQAVAAQAPAAVAVSAEKLASLVKELRMLAAVQESEYPNFQIIIEEAAKALESSTSALPVTEDSSAGDREQVQAEPVAFDATYTNRVIEALHENGDPVSVDAAEEMAKIRDLLLSAPQSQPADAEVTAYEVGGCSVERVLQRSGAFMWSVRREGSVLNTQGKWEYEPQPSSRTDDFLERCRFDTARAAIDAAMAAAQEGGA